jgi:hypothetical protein
VEVYNCLAWAADVTTAWWWPLGDPQKTYWPEGVARTETMEAFRDAFAKLGYEVCEHAELETSHQKIALFATPDGCPQHAARQRPNGRWTSKLGAREDIEHALHDLEGMEYGVVVLVMKRPVLWAPAGEQREDLGQ